MGKGGIIENGYSSGDPAVVVVVVEVVVHVPHLLLVEWNVEGGVDCFCLQICAKYGSVSLCEKGHWRCHKDFGFLLKSVVYCSNQHLQLASTRLPTQHAVQQSEEEESQGSEELFRNLWCFARQETMSWRWPSNMVTNDTDFLPREHARSQCSGQPPMSFRGT